MPLKRRYRLFSLHTDAKVQIPKQETVVALVDLLFSLLPYSDCVKCLIVDVLQVYQTRLQTLLAMFQVGVDEAQERVVDKHLDYHCTLVCHLSQETQLDGVVTHA